MSGPRPIDIIPDVTNVALEDVNRIITVVDDCSGTTVDVVQPLTTIIQVSDAGLQGPQGAKGEPGSTQPFSDIGGGVWFTSASLLVSSSRTTGDLFLIKNGYTSVAVSSSQQVAVAISSSAQNIINVQNANQQTVFNISGSGTVTFATQANAPQVAEDATSGKLWFTNTDIYVSLDN